jgi:hypothetical protein
MSSKNQDSIWSNRITTIGFLIIIIGILINISFQIMKYFDIDISSVIVYICFFIFMIICYFVLPKDIPMGLVLPKTPIPSAPEFTEL